jgi:short subunit dehydrogenase-like uncharacterized protein
MKILVFGASGFVGRRLVAHLKKEAELFDQVVCTGRSVEKLDETLGTLPENFEKRALDLRSLDQVRECVRTADVVLNMAGPFKPIAPPVVEACAELGTHYLDITGEYDFTREMLERFGRTAERNRACIVPGAGFDSVPSDVLAIETGKRLAEETGEPCARIDLVFNARGGFNGGTMATIFQTTEDFDADGFVDAHYLLPDREPRLEKDKYGLRRIEPLKTWASAFFMEAINSKIVYRSAFEGFESSFAPDFVYRESQAIGKSRLTNRLAAGATSTFLSLFNAPLGRRVLKRILPSPGEGPSEKSITEGFYSATAVAATADGQTLTTKLSAKGDPGNESTVNCVLACLDGLKVGPSRFGVLTPTMAFPRLLDHVQGRGAVFKELDRQLKNSKQPEPV